MDPAAESVFRKSYAEFKRLEPLQPTKTQHFAYYERDPAGTRRLRFACRTMKARCLGQTKKHARCLREVAKGLGFCPAHLRQVMGVEIRASPGKGLGLFAVKPFKRDASVGTFPKFCDKSNERADAAPGEVDACAFPYWGALVSNDVNRLRYDKLTTPRRERTAVYGKATRFLDRAKRDVNWLSVDAACVRSFASYINAPNPGEQANVEFRGGRDFYGGVFPVVVAIRDIRPGEELLIDYGARYGFDADVEYETRTGKLPQCAAGAGNGCVVPDLGAYTLPDDVAPFLSPHEMTGAEKDEALRGFLARAEDRARLGALSGDFKTTLLVEFLKLEKDKGRPASVKTKARRLVGAEVPLSNNFDEVVAAVFGFLADNEAVNHSLPAMQAFLNRKNIEFSASDTLEQLKARKRFYEEMLNLPTLAALRDYARQHDLAVPADVKGKDNLAYAIYLARYPVAAGGGTRRHTLKRSRR